MSQQLRTLPELISAVAPDKRIRINRQNLKRFFSTDKHKDARKFIFHTMSPTMFITMARLYLDHRDQMESMWAYCRRFKQAVRELTPEDIEAVAKEFAVEEVMES